MSAAVFGCTVCPDPNPVSSERVKVLKKSRLLTAGHTPALKRVFVGMFTAGVLSVCLSMPCDVFADSTEAVQADAASAPVSADPNAVPKDADVPTVDASKAVGADSEQTPEQWRVVHMRVTAYCPCSKCCGEYADGITADNHRIQDGDRFVAADKTYAFGTEIVIPGYNDSEPVHVKDRGGAIQGQRLDVFFNTHQEALEWGVQYLDVKIKNK